MAINGSTLASLKRGQRGVIRAINAADPQVQRLMVLGLVEGTEVEHASSAIGGDPMEFRPPFQSCACRGW
jgi:Fe2+ transport system protein FeoA